MQSPDGALRVLLSTEKTDLKLPRALDFVVEPHVLEDSSAPFLLGYPTLMGTGLLKVILGLEQFEPELESTADATELDDDELWYSEQQSKEEHSKEEHRRFWYQFDPGLDLDEFQMPIIKGTTEEL